VGEGHEEVVAHLLVALAREEVVRGGTSTSTSGRRRWGSPAAALRRARGDGLWPMSFTGIRGSRSRAPLGQKKAGGRSSTESGRPAGLCAAATACRRRLRGADGFGRVTGRRWSCWGTRFGEREGDGAGRRGGRGRRRPWLTASVACEQSSARVR